MKTISLIAAIVLVAGSTSVFGQSKTLNTSKSEVLWTGNKIGGSHHGTIAIKSGNLELKGNKLTGGTIVMDMTSIADTDLQDETYNQKLVGHLKSDDFFGVEKFPESTFVITKSTAFKNGKAQITGNITIKGKTESLTFEATQEGNSYKAQVKVDRSKFDVRYGSNSFFDNLGDKAIDDIFILDITLVL